jgi:hypothetical protein
MDWETELRQLLDEEFTHESAAEAELTAAFDALSEVLEGGPIRSELLADETASIAELLANETEQASKITELLANEKEQASKITGLLANEKEQASKITELLANEKEQASKITELETKYLCLVAAVQRAQYIRVECPTNGPLKWYGPKAKQRRSNQQRNYVVTSRVQRHFAISENTKNQLNF